MSNKNDAELFIGYIDKNHDGINDLYCDKNGDGKNDINNKIIIPNIKFIDKNKDNINDIFVDADGDGVNDIYIHSRYNPVIDIDSNNINDITGIKYRKGYYLGFRYGNVFEEKGELDSNYIDKNNDYMDDNIIKKCNFRKHDKFVDADNDGICDGRENELNSNRGKKGKHAK